MAKIVINTDYGGFGLSDSAIREVLKRKFGNYKEEGPDKYGYHHFYVNGEYFYDRELERDDPILVSVVEEMQEKAEGRYAILKVVEIPDDVKWHIVEYDGREHIAEDHRTWR